MCTMLEPFMLKTAVVCQLLNPLYALNTFFLNVDSHESPCLNHDAYISGSVLFILKVI